MILLIPPYHVCYNMPHEKLWFYCYLHALVPPAALLQDECQRRVRKLVTEETGKTLKVIAGWYTERQMKEMLKMPKPLGYILIACWISSGTSNNIKISSNMNCRHEIDSVVEYTSTRPKLRRTYCIFLIWGHLLFREVGPFKRTLQEVEVQQQD